MFKHRRLETRDYPVLLGWWKWFRFPAPKQTMLPDNGKGGIMVSKDGINICAGFIYQTNSNFCLIEYIVSNPSYKDKDRKEAVKHLIELLEKTGKSLGFQLVFSSVKNENLTNTFKDVGYTISESKEVIKLI
jgi:hypothetical protein